MARRGKGRRVNVKGRNNTSRFARLDYRILNSNAYRSLSPNDRSLLVELLMLFNGENNGSLYLSVRDAAARMGLADLTAASASFTNLQDLGFIQLTMPSEFRSGSSNRSKARCWRLTWLQGPGRKLPSWDFLEREPLPKTKARKRMDRGLRALKTYWRAREAGKLSVLDSDTMDQFRLGTTGGAVLDSGTPTNENGGFQPNSKIPDSATHIATPWVQRCSNQLVGWWQPDWTPLIEAWTIAGAIAAQRGEAHERQAA